MTVDIDALLEAMRQPGPTPDPDLLDERDDYYTQTEIDQRGDDAADLDRDRRNP